MITNDDKIKCSWQQSKFNQNIFLYSQKFFTTNLMHTMTNFMCTTTI